MDYLKGLLAGPEMALSLGSGLLAQPLSGLAGLLALPAGPERAANAVRATQERLTYQPQTEGGQRMVGALGGLMAPVGQAFEAARRVTGDVGYAVGGPLGGALGAAVPDALSMVPMGALYRGLRGAPQSFPLPNQAQAGAIVYHGSPHKFDKFDSSKIGTGEGAQAYGHGLYFAENPAVAFEYQRTGRDPGFTYDGTKIDRVKNTVQETAAKLLYEAKGDKAAALKAADGYAYDNLLKPAIESMDPQKVGIGNLYKVDLPDSAIEKMLDWDKPLSQQPESVRNFAAQWNGGKMPRESMSGDELLRWVQQQANFLGKGKAEDLMREAGITGIRYLDGGSRGNGSMFKQFATEAEAQAFAKQAGGTATVQPRHGQFVVVGEPAKTSNYVVFPGNEGLLKILERQ